MRTMSDKPKDKKPDSSPEDEAQPDAENSQASEEISLEQSSENATKSADEPSQEPNPDIPVVSSPEEPENSSQASALEDVAKESSEPPKTETKSEEAEKLIQPSASKVQSQAAVENIDSPPEVENPETSKDQSKETTLENPEASKAQSQTEVENAENPEASKAQSKAEVENAEASKAQSQAEVENAENPEASKAQSQTEVENAENPEASKAQSKAEVENAEASKAKSQAEVENAENPEASKAQSQAEVENAEASKAKSQTEVENAENPEASKAQSQAEVENAEASKAKSQAEVENAENPEASKAQSQVEVENAEASKAQSQAAVDSSEAQLTEESITDNPVETKEGEGEEKSLSTTPSKADEIIPPPSEKDDKPTPAVGPVEFGNLLYEFDQQKWILEQNPLKETSANQQSPCTTTSIQPQSYEPGLNVGEFDKHQWILDPVPPYRNLVSTKSQMVSAGESGCCGRSDKNVWPLTFCQQVQAVYDVLTGQDSYPCNECDSKEAPNESLLQWLTSVIGGAIDSVKSIGAKPDTANSGCGHTDEETLKTNTKGTMAELDDNLNPVSWNNEMEEGKIFILTEDGLKMGIENIPSYIERRSQIKSSAYPSDPPVPSLSFDQPPGISKSVIPQVPQGGFADELPNEETKEDADTSAINIELVSVDKPDGTVETDDKLAVDENKSHVKSMIELYEAKAAESSESQRQMEANASRISQTAEGEVGEEGSSPSKTIANDKQ